MKKQRKHYTPEEKVAILRRHLLDTEPVSKLCDEIGLKRTVLYRWQKEFFENGAAAFDPEEANGPDRGLRPAMVREDRDQRRAVYRVAQHHRQQVLRLAGTLRQGERA